MAGRRRLIVFDVDGTLVDSQHEIVEAQARAFAAFGLPTPTRGRALSVVGLSLHEAFVALAGPDAPIAGLADAYKDAWTELRMRPGYADRLYAGAREAVDALAARPDVLLGLATGKSRKGVARILAAQGWEATFATIQTADDHPSKPHPSMVLSALDETDVAVRDAIMVGDTSFDMEMAVAAGVRPIGVAWGYHPVGDLTTSGAAAVVDDFTALRAWLDTFINTTEDKACAFHEE